MTKQAISVTLSRDNLIWLRGRAAATDARSASEILDRLIAAARMGGQIAPPRSVAGTIDIDSADPSLEGADALVRDLFETSLSRPLVQRTAAKLVRSKQKSRPVRHG